MSNPSTAATPQPRAAFLAAGLSCLLLVGCRSADPRVRAAAPPPPRAQGAVELEPRLSHDRPGPPRGGSLAELLDHAAEHSPRARAAHARWRAAVERVPQADALPDPRLSLRWYAREVETRVGPQEWAAGVGQTFPLGGKRGLRGDVALARAAAAWEQYRAAELAVVREVKDAWYEACYLGRAIEIVDRNREIVADFVEVAQSLYRSGEAQYADVIRAQIELGILDDRLRSLTDLKSPVRARLNAAANLPPGTELEWPTATPELSDELGVGAPEIAQAILDGNPELQALQHEARSSEHAIELAAREAYPDVSLGLDWISTGDAADPGVADSGVDPLILGVSLDLPLWAEKYRAGEREARARLRAAVSRRDERSNALLSETELVLYGARDAQRKIRLYRDTLIPRARQTLEATAAAYRAGSADFLALVDAETVALEFELAYERARADLAQSLAKLEQLCARPLAVERGSARPETTSGGASEEDEP